MTQPVPAPNDLSSQRLYHGTKADRKRGDLIAPGYTSNFGKRKKANYVYSDRHLGCRHLGR